MRSAILFGAILISSIAAHTATAETCFSNQTLQELSQNFKQLKTFADSGKPEICSKEMGCSKEKGNFRWVTAASEELFEQEESYIPYPEVEEDDLSIRYKNKIKEFPKIEDSYDNSDYDGEN